MKRRLGLVLVVVGIAALVLGALSATVWRASNQVSMTAPRPSQPVVIADPGVLAMLDGDVTISAAGEGSEPVELVLAPPAEIEAWVAGSPHQQVTGAASWEELSVEDVPLAEGATETVPSLQGVDGWPVLETGDGTVELTHATDGSTYGLLAITDGTAPAPQITLTWQREVATPWLWPGVIGGGLIAVAGVVLFVLGERERRAQAQRRDRRRTSASDETNVLPVVRSGSTAVAKEGPAAKAEETSPKGEDSSVKVADPSAQADTPEARPTADTPEQAETADTPEPTETEDGR